MLLYVLYIQTYLIHVLFNFFFFPEVSVAESRIPYGGQINSWWMRRYFFYLQIAAISRPKNNVSLPLFRIQRRPREVSKIALVTARSQIFIPSLFKSLRGELAIAKKFGQFKQIKSGDCSAVAQSFHSPICTVILHYPLIVTYTFHSPNMKDKYWIHLNLYSYQAERAGEESIFGVFMLPSTGHTTVSGFLVSNFSLFSGRRGKGLRQTVGNAARECLQ